MSGPLTRPQAIVLACWPGDDPLLQRLNLDPATVMLGDKPMARRVIETLVELGCRDIGVVLGDQPERIRRLLGDGESWGCSIRYCYATAGTRPLQVLARWRPAQGEHCLLATADTVIGSMPAVPCNAAVCSAESGNIRWSGWARLSSSAFAQLVLEARGRGELERRILGADFLQRVWDASPVSTADAARMLDSVERIFTLSPGLSGIMRRPSGASVWIGNGSRVHPGAKLVAPVFIGNYARIESGAQVGPNAVIGDGCLVDQGARIESSFVAPATYIGAGLELRAGVASPNGFASVRLGTVIGIPDKHLIGAVGASENAAARVPLAQRLFAGALWGLAWPLAKALRRRETAHAEPSGTAVARFDAARGTFVSLHVRLRAAHETVFAGRSGAWLRHFLRTFHPGLRDVAAGRLALVGMQPRSPEEAGALPDHWRHLYAEGLTGLINETLLLGPDGASADMRYAGDALAARSVPLRRILPLLVRYARHVAGDARASIDSPGARARNVPPVDAQQRGTVSSVATSILK